VLVYVLSTLYHGHHRTTDPGGWREMQQLSFIIDPRPPHLSSCLFFFVFVLFFSLEGVKGLAAMTEC
jgi:hypothetical protein